MALIREVTRVGSAFDAVAAEYARDVRSNVILEWMRTQARRALLHHAPRGARLLELGCGPGVDAVWCAQHGYDVTAIDASPAMVERATWRTTAASVAPHVRVVCLPIEHVDDLAPDVFDAVYSSLGPLNCVDLERAAPRIADRVKEGGVLIATVMGRLCPWEWMRFGLTGQCARAALRSRRGVVMVSVGGQAVATRYYTPRQLTAVFERCGLRTLTIRGLGLFAPPPYLSGFITRHPEIVRTLLWLDNRLGALPGVRSCGDHFLLVMRKAWPASNTPATDPAAVRESSTASNPAADSSDADRRRDNISPFRRGPSRSAGRS
jgi:SAM-dependent methyltransferase